MSRGGVEPDRVADALHSASIRVLRIVRAEDAHSGIGPAQLSALSVLVFHGPQTLRDLAGLEQVRPPTMSRIVDGLVRQGLARRAADPADRRVVRVTPTPRGQRLLQEGRARRVQALAGRLTALSKDEIETLARAAALMARL
jgi:DNA-binding MarR family transcriptional regulator